MSNSKPNIFPAFIPRQVALKRKPKSTQPATTGPHNAEVICEPPQSSPGALDLKLTTREDHAQAHSNLAFPQPVLSISESNSDDKSPLITQPRLKASFSQLNQPPLPESTQCPEPKVTFNFTGVPIQHPPPVDVARRMAEPPVKRAKRTDSAAMWESHESTASPTSYRLSEDSRESKRKDSQRDIVNQIREQRRDDNRRDDRRRRSRSRERPESQKERSRSREPPATGRDRDREKDRDRLRDDRRDRERERDRNRERDYRSSRRERERSRSPDTRKTSKGRFATWPEYEGLPD
jgi:hypothetical protein